MKKKQSKHKGPVELMFDLVNKKNFLEKPINAEKLDINDLLIIYTNALRLIKYLSLKERTKQCQ